MILDRIENAGRYFAMHKHLAKAFDYLAHHDPKDLADGRYEIDSSRAYLIMAHYHGRGYEEARLEAHRQYIDVQIPLNVPEDFGWREKTCCQSVSKVYDEKADIEFFSDPPTCWITVEPGCFILFFPHDAHAPLACTGGIHKAILKLAVG
jgi:YhcH/YjgK/YiaL family protein